VEQNARRALEMADRGCVLDLGRIHAEGPAHDLLNDPSLGRLYLGGRPGAAGGGAAAATGHEGRAPAAPAPSNENDT